MATRKKSSAAKKQSTPRTAPATTTAKPSEDASLNSPATTTFPPGDCQAGLPASTSFHDVTFAEFKRINRTIDDLPYPIVLSDINETATHTVDKFASHEYASFMQRSLVKAMGSGLTAMGGI